MVAAERNSIHSASFVVGCLIQLLDCSTERYLDSSVAFRSEPAAVVVAALAVVVVVEVLVVAVVALVGPVEAALEIVVELAVVELGTVAEPVELGIAADVASELDTADTLDIVLVAAAPGPDSAADVELEPDKVEPDLDIAVAVRVPDTAVDIAAGTEKQR